MTENTVTTENNQPAVKKNKKQGPSAASRLVNILIDTLEVILSIVAILLIIVGIITLVNDDLREPFVNLLLHYSEVFKSYIVH